MFYSKILDLKIFDLKLINILPQIHFGTVSSKHIQNFRSLGLILHELHSKIEGRLVLHLEFQNEFTIRNLKVQMYEISKIID